MDEDSTMSERSPGGTAEALMGDALQGLRSGGGGGGGHQLW